MNASEQESDQNSENAPTRPKFIVVREGEGVLRTEGDVPSQGVVWSVLRELLPWVRERKTDENKKNGAAAA